MPDRFSRQIVMRSAFLLLGAGLAAGFFTGCNRGKPADGPSVPAKEMSGAEPSSSLARVRTIRPTREHLKRVTTQPAHVEPFEKIDVYANLAGYVTRLGQVRGADGKERDIDIGDRVAKDQVLLILSVPELGQQVNEKKAAAEKAQAEVKQAEAAKLSADAMVAAAGAKVSQANAEIEKWDAETKFRKGEADRYQRLANEGTATPEQAAEKKNQYLTAVAGVAAVKASLATAEADVKVAEAKRVEAVAAVEAANAQVRVAQAAHAQAQALFNYTEIRAEFPGVITRRMVDRGAFVRSAATGQTQPLFTLARVDRVRVVADIPETDSAAVTIGQPAVIRIDALRGQAIPGKLMRLADALDPSTRTMRVEVEPDTLPAGIRTGQFGTVAITLADHLGAVMLPASVLLTGEKPAVMIVADGKAVRREVTIGLNDGARVQVTAGLTGDEAVIAEGKGGVHEGQPVDVMN
jgi:RND family efflux transporter MFP subunit